MLHTDAMVLTGAVTFLIPDTPNAGGEAGHDDERRRWPRSREDFTALADRSCCRQRILPDASRDPWVRRWYEATTAVLLYGSQLATLGGHLRERQALIPDDAGAVFDEACVYEAFANDRVQTVAASERAHGRDLAVPGRTEALSRAKRTFESVLIRDPEHAEARLRLGRVLWGLGETRRSADELASIAQRTETPRELRYLAFLFLGESRWSQGESTLAAEAYEAALALYPKAQSPVVGLLSVKPRLMEDDLTRGERVPGLPATDRVDPWLNYHLGAGRTAP
jgi:tetratricopeptide (TPR) repeat protein